MVVFPLRGFRGTLIRDGPSDELSGAEEVSVNDIIFNNFLYSMYASEELGELTRMLELSMSEKASNVVIWNKIGRQAMDVQR